MHKKSQVVTALVISEVTYLHQQVTLVIQMMSHFKNDKILSVYTIQDISAKDPE